MKDPSLSPGEVWKDGMGYSGKGGGENRKKTTIPRVTGSGLVKRAPWNRTEETWEGGSRRRCQADLKVAFGLPVPDHNSPKCNSPGEGRSAVD